MTRDQIAYTLTQWAYENLPATIAPRVLIVEDPNLQIGVVEIVIRSGCRLPSEDPKPLPPKAAELADRPTGCAHHARDVGQACDVCGKVKAP